MKKDVNYIDVVLGVLLGLPLAFLRGWVVSIMWGWFLVPSLGVPQIGVVYSTGLLLIIGYILSGKDTKLKDPESDSNWYVTATMVGKALGALIVLLMGFVLTLFL